MHRKDPTCAAGLLADALIDDGRVGALARSASAADPHWAAPAHLLVEVVSVIRGRALGGRLSPVRAQDAVDALPTLVIDQIDTAALIDRMWQLRGSITAYDAAYVAAAEILGCPLVTADGRLAKANGMPCEIRVISPT